jgi:hypothetical protein
MKEGIDIARAHFFLAMVLRTIGTYSIQFFGPHGSLNPLASWCFEPLVRHTVPPNRFGAASDLHGIGS